ncbi:MAG: hypothetical protein MUF54_20695, partial [Polyangiaceae bacterium]|nr:hypothetical protein [Polyangiaceae bacterium]
EDPVPATTFHRNLVMLTVGYMWPPRDLPQIPRGQTQRVDGGDRDPRAPGNETTTGAEAARGAQQRGRPGAGP